MVLIYQAPKPHQCDRSEFPTDDVPGTVRACPDCGKTWVLRPGYYSNGYWRAETRMERWRRQVGIWIRWQRAKWSRKWRRSDVDR